MADRIKDLLYRRSDLSTFLVHFTRGNDHAEALNNLLCMLRNHVIEARTAYGMAANLDDRTSTTPVSQRTVCFTDTPLEHCWMMVREIEKRRWKFQPYGIAFTKGYARSCGCNPVWYIDTTPGYTWLTHAVNRLVNAAKEQADDPFLDPEKLDILQIAPFFEQSGTGKDFAWEREWRFRGHFHFGGPHNVMAVFAPELTHPALRSHIASFSTDWADRNVPLLDPEWGLERMLVAMSGVAR